jgi:hypothetical protein
MTQIEDDIVQLRAEIVETRRKRMAAQRTIAGTPDLQVAIDRVARDRSTGDTGETDALRAEIHTLRDDIVHEARQIDRIREIFPRVDAEYPQLTPRTRLVKEFDEERLWRDGVVADGRSSQLRLTLPSTKEVV